MCSDLAVATARDTPRIERLSTPRSDCASVICTSVRFPQIRGWVRVAYIGQATGSADSHKSEGRDDDDTQTGPSAGRDTDRG